MKRQTGIYAVLTDFGSSYIRTYVSASSKAEARRCVGGVIRNIQYACKTSQDIAQFEKDNPI